MAKKNRSEKYWRDRIEVEMKRQQQKDADIGQEMQKLYNHHLKNIENEYNSFITRYGLTENISQQEVLKRISTMDVALFNDKAERYVTEKDFSPEANAELKLYNLTMKLNRLDLLKYNIDLEMVALTDGEYKLTGKYLEEEYINEIRRQSGILGLTVPEPHELRAQAETVINRDFYEVKWSDSIWERQNLLRGIVTDLVDQAVLRGKGGLSFIPELRKEFNVGSYEAKRLVVTEIARVQTEAQKESYIRNGNEEYEYMAEPSACSICAALDGKVFKVKDMQPGKNACPMHPHCHCTSAPKAEREELNRMFQEYEEMQNKNTKRPPKFEPSKDIRQANKFAREDLGLIADYKGIDVRVANEWNEGLHNMKYQFPEVFQGIKFVGSSQQRNALIKKDLLEKFTAIYDAKYGKSYPQSAISDAAKRDVNKFMRKSFKISEDNMASSLKLDSYTQKEIDGDIILSVIQKYEGITLNQKFYKDYEYAVASSAYQVNQQWHPEGCESVKATFDHEFAHQIDDLIKVRENPKIQAIFDNNGYNDIKEGLSEYSVKNRNPNKYSEMIAEGWSEYQNNPEPREIAKQIGEEIERMWEEWKN